MDRMESYKLKPLQYAITDRVLGSRAVKGYAINCELPVKLCVHSEGSGRWRHWVCDHYYTGAAVGRPWRTREEAIRDGVQLIRRTLASGEYDQAIARFYSMEMT